MKRADLHKVKGFAEWASTQESRQFLNLLAMVVDDEVGDTGFVNVTPHHAHINLGIQDATRRIVKIVRDPLAIPERATPMPPPTYGVRPPTDPEISA